LQPSVVVGVLIGLASGSVALQADEVWHCAMNGEVIAVEHRKLVIICSYSLFDREKFRFQLPSRVPFISNDDSKVV
jgi:hypothetical protein